MNHTAVDIGQTEVTAGVAVGQSFVVETHEVQNRRVQVMNVHRVLDSLKTKFICRSVDDSPLHPSTSEDPREAGRVAVAAQLYLSVVGDFRPCLFSSPDPAAIPSPADPVAWWKWLNLLGTLGMEWMSSE